MEKLSDTDMAEVAGLSTARTKMRISQASRRWSTVVGDKGPAIESCHMRMQDARCKLVNALWRKSEYFSQWLEEASRHAPEELWLEEHAPEELLERGQTLGEVTVRGRAAESWRRWEEIYADHCRILSECFRAMISGCGDEEAEMQVDQLWERSLGPELKFLLHMACSYLRLLEGT